MGSYKNAQVCLNGHATTDDVSQAEFCSPFCSYCGEKTITACTKCGSPIRGEYCADGITFMSVSYSAPAYCHNCGEPYPWTQRRIAAAQELFSDFDLTTEDRDKLDRCFPNIVADTPMTTVSANRVRNYLEKLPAYVSSCLRDILVDIASETAKKIIWPS
ncbi:DUF2321 domain-containing protein [Selenomonas sp. ND2010]|uniref:DUF2321 domain-containing protein n=1 Tax=Selenomonas sp. ND2010 TaxID=1410618 RepID=UPI00051B0F3C|nr:DUF2321 domain-containing protein [Selenomonas sp. ND2010]